MTGAAAAKPPEGWRSEKLDHEECSESGNRVEALDTNGDKKADVRRVFDGSGHEKCRIADLSFNGKPDLYEYFDGSGAIRRREFCYDDTGVVNAIETYQGGKLVSRQYDTSGQHKVDTWEWFDPSAAIDPKTGRPAHPTRRERDTTGRGVVDQWWTWDGDKVTIATDRDGDGKPDPASVIVLGGSPKDNPSAAPPGAPAPASSAATDGGAPGAAPAAVVAGADASGRSPSSREGGAP